jgi:hypothetical protein
MVDFSNMILLLKTLPTSDSFSRLYILEQLASFIDNTSMTNLPLSRLFSTPLHRHVVMQRHHAPITTAHH